MTDAERWMEELESLGGTFKLRGEEVKVEYPDEMAEVVRPILEKLRRRKEEVRKLLYKHPPGILESGECSPLPAGVRLVRYTPKSSPVLIAPWSVVTNV